MMNGNFVAITCMEGRNRLFFAISTGIVFQTKVYSCGMNCIAQVYMMQRRIQFCDLVKWVG